MESNTQITKEEEFLSRNQSIEEQVWIDSNVSKIDELLRFNYEKTVDRFAEIVLTSVAELLGSLRGAFYIVDHAEEKISAIAGFACKIENMQKKEFSIGEDLIGYAVKSKKFRHIDNLPANNAVVNSGLAAVNTTNLIISPLEFNDVIYGVIELNNLGLLESKQIELIKRLSRNIASTFQSIINNEKTKKLVEELQEKTQEMEAQDEELRQNLYQLTSIQEELNKEKILMDSLMKNIPDNIFFKDLESKYLLVSENMAKQYNTSSSRDLLGKSDFDFLSEEDAQKAFDEEQKIIKTSRPIIDKIIHSNLSDGESKWLSITKMPLKDTEDKVVGTFGLSRDITELKENEDRANEMTARVEEQREELEQNLEELRTTQDDLRRKQENLMWESAMFNTLMDHLTARVTFKDKDSSFKRVNRIKAQRHGFDNPDEIIGKSDADFFSKEHAEKARKEELEIMQSGKSMVRKEEKLTYTNGQIAWGMTTRVPLTNNQGETIGTFIITEDITSQKLAEGKASNQSRIVQELINNTSSIFYRIDHKGNISEISGKGLDSIGMTKNDFVGKNAKQIFPALGKSKKTQKEFSFAIKGQNNNEKWEMQHLVFPDDTVHGGLIGIAFQI